MIDNFEVDTNGYCLEKEINCLNIYKNIILVDVIFFKKQ